MGDIEEGSQIPAGVTLYSLALRNNKYQKQIKRVTVFNFSNKKESILDFLDETNSLRKYILAIFT
jgi:hypothetical protein